MKKVFWDQDSSLYYVIHNSHKLYFKRSLNSPEKVLTYYRNILTEQDVESPHKYLDNSFTTYENDIDVDVRVAEGNFALEVIDKASKVYLVESDPEWVEALEYTFAPYKDKVIILNSFISSYSEGKIHKLDDLISEKVNFIKMDIEGSEWDGLIGAEELINRSEDVKLAICA